MEKTEKGITLGESVTVNGIVFQMFRLFCFFAGLCHDGLLGLFKVRSEGGNASLDHYLICSLTPGIGYTCQQISNISKQS